MVKLRNMQAWCDSDNLISYTTCIAWKRGKYLIIRDYPTITSKKHLLAWFTDYCECNISFIRRVLKDARKNHKEWILIVSKDEKTNQVDIGYSAYTRKDLEMLDVWQEMLQKYTPTI